MSWFHGSQEPNRFAAPPNGDQESSGAQAAPELVGQPGLPQSFGVASSLRSPARPEPEREWGPNGVAH